jgi:TatD DNase family protein
MYFESHAHYDDKQFNADRDQLLKEFPSCGIDIVINSASGLKSSRTGLKLAEKYDYIYASVGVHPHELNNMTDETIAELRRLADHKKCVAIGEIGLDYHYENNPRETQRFWFKKQLKLAEELRLPVIIHSREASQECFDIIRQSKVRKGVIHCYSGSAEMAKEYVKMGFYIGIGGVVTYPNARSMVETAEAIPLEKILIETDSPYLAPVPNRGKRNDSRNLEYIVNKLADIKNVSPEKVANITFQNGKKLFLK